MNFGPIQAFFLELVLKSQFGRVKFKSHIELKIGRGNSNLVGPPLTVTEVFDKVCYNVEKERT